jgi:hypothetical protein
LLLARAARAMKVPRGLRLIFRKQVWSWRIVLLDCEGLLAVSKDISFLADLRSRRSDRRSLVCCAFMKSMFRLCIAQSGSVSDLASSFDWRANPFRSRSWIADTRLSSLSPDVIKAINWRRVSGLSKLPSVRRWVNT